MTILQEQQIIESWYKNAKSWTDAIKNKQIASREHTTNQAVIDAILTYSPKTVLDIGCGEGWLTRTLTSHNINTYGIDTVPELIAYAQHQGQGKFSLMSYDNINPNTIQDKFDIAVCNFSLFGKHSVNNLIKKIPRLLNDKGYFILQTLHPLIEHNNRVYQDGWREGSWCSCGNSFSDPAPWYFRTLASWVDLLADCHFLVTSIKEPKPQDTPHPLSIIFICQKTEIDHHTS
ncbi:class I SAM-dependent methyltransferase [Zooshikella harenae]|uniref:Methyltransferase domain-containing protein n=1 Tax=Zooshikella harenae TaxID=2827238 RepID=A0ABS5Z996_9GAMM|nr:methyltransferase domain-containing protein [Zooshikella harenae]MBU2710560.1 methyltransferase domain-containing protein [Zooshikella harenae]